jgi:DNA polymerase-1
VSPSSPSGAPARILIVDGTNTLYRAFFAIPGLRAPDGTPTNAAYGFVNTLQKLTREESPDCAIVVFDPRGKTRRHALFAEYKAGRDAQPEDLSAQFPLVRELLAALHVPIIEVAGYEADDVIATLVERAPATAQISIVSTDKDLMQLVSERVTLLDGMKDRRFGPAQVAERFGVAPERVLDLRALVGDPSDNIPGVKGIGEKGAAKLLEKWGDLETLLANAERVEPAKARQALQTQEAQARLSKQLSTLEVDAPIAGDYADWALQAPDLAALRSLYERLGFTRLLDALWSETENPRATAGAAVELALEIVDTPEGAARIAEELTRLPRVALAPVLEGESAMLSQLTGLAVALDGSRCAYLPAAGPAGGLPIEALVDVLRPALEAPGRVAWLARDAKPLWVFLAEQGLEVASPDFDVELAAQLIDPSGSRALAAQALLHLSRKLESWEDLAGRGAKARNAAELPLEAVARHAAAEALAVRDLEAPLRARLAADELATLYEEVELPLVRILAEMERRGVRVEESVLARLSTEYQAQLASIESRIYGLAGGPFNIASPKQLQHVLFEKLALPATKKTKTGFSTDEDVLEQLAADHELPAQVLAHRRLAKLVNTYVEALPKLVNPRTGRIHPTFHQLGAATGRLSSSHPNVQNIPIRSEEGVRIRGAFVAAEGATLVSADYSQVELRILAHYSGDESLIEAFRAGEDIHRRTAAEVAGIEPKQVDAEQRARAKAVNFGIIYGLSAFGLARTLGIASAEAQATIDAYFARYKGVRSFLDETIARAAEQGYVRTWLGRRRYLPDLASRNRALRNASERMAVNTVIQGTAADLIKKAMIAVDESLRAEGLRARMILQVHDELVLELPPAERERVAELLRERMEGVLSLRVPLSVDVGSGASWREAH